MRVAPAIASGLALALTVAVPQAVGRPLAPPPVPRAGRTVADAGIRLPLPRRWHGLVVRGGIGSDPFGIGELVIANFRLPRSAGECESLVPKLAAHQALLRIYDYGPGPLGGAWRAGALRLGRLRPVHDRAMGSQAITVARIRFHGRFVVVDGAFGARSPSAAILGRVARLLNGAVAI